MEEQIQNINSTLQTNDLFIYFASLAVLIGVGLFLYIQKKKHPKLKMGTLINKLIIENRESVFLMGAALVNFFEALVSASIHPIGQLPINGFARFGAHGITAAISIACAVYFGQYFKAWIEMMYKKNRKDFNFTQFFVRFLLVFVSLFGMISGPFVNLFIVANGTGEIDNCTLLLMEILYTDEYMSAYYEFVLQYPSNYDPFKEMSYVMAASFAMTFFHFILMFLDSLTALDRKDGEHFNFSGDLGDNVKETAQIHKDINERSQKQKEKDQNDFMGNVKFLLMRYGYHGTHLDKMAKAGKLALDKMDDNQHKMHISGLCAKLRMDITTWDENERKTLESENKKADIDSKNAQFNDRIFKLFQAPIKAGNGLGITLKKLKGTT